MHFNSFHLENYQKKTQMLSADGHPCCITEVLSQVGAIQRLSPDLNHDVYNLNPFIVEPEP